MYTLNHYMKSLYPSLSPSRDFSLSLPISLSLSPSLPPQSVLAPTALEVLTPHIYPRILVYLVSCITKSSTTTPTSILGVIYHQVIYHQVY